MPTFFLSAIPTHSATPNTLENHLTEQQLKCINIQKKKYIYIKEKMENRHRDSSFT